MKGRLLIVDDERPIGENLSRFFARRGLQVAWAGTGADALAQLAAQPFDVVLLDLRLPDAFGLDLLARMPAARPRIVVLTAHEEGGIDPGSREASVDAFVQKPVDLRSLEALLARLLAPRESPTCSGRSYAMERAPGCAGGTRGARRPEILGRSTEGDASQT